MRHRPNESAHTQVEIAIQLPPSCSPRIEQVKADRDLNLWFRFSGKTFVNSKKDHILAFRPEPPKERVERAERRLVGRLVWPVWSIVPGRPVRRSTLLPRRSTLLVRRSTHSGPPFHPFWSAVPPILVRHSTHPGPPFHPFWSAVPPILIRRSTHSGPPFKLR